MKASTRTTKVVGHRPKAVGHRRKAHRPVAEPQLASNGGKPVAAPAVQLLPRVDGMPARIVAAPPC